MKVFNVKIFQKIKRHLLCKNYLIRNLYILFVKKYLVKLKDDEIGIICDLNLGETYLFCSMLDYFKEDHGLEKIVFVSDRKYHKNICQMFDDKIDRYYISPHINTKSFVSLREIKKGSFYLIYDKNWNFTNLKNSGNSHLQQLKITAKINTFAKINHHKNKENYRLEAKEIFDSLQLKPGKTVLISPEAKSCNSMDRDQYSDLIEKLKNKGYDIFLNVNNSENNIPGVKSIFLPLPAAVPFCDLCGHVIAIRSGFCDIISSTQAKLHIVYPDQSYLDVFPMKDKITSEEINEYILDTEGKYSLIDSIISNF